MVIISELKSLASPSPNNGAKPSPVDTTPRKRKAVDFIRVDAQRSRVDSPASSRCVTPPPTCDSPQHEPRTPQQRSLSVLELDSGTDSETEVNRKTSSLLKDDIFSSPLTPRAATSPAIIKAIPGSPLALSLQRTLRKRERARSGVGDGGGGKNLLEEFQKEKDRLDPLQSPSKKQKVKADQASKVGPPSPSKRRIEEPSIDLPDVYQVLISVYNGLERAILLRLATTTSFPSPTKIQNSLTNSVTLQIDNLVTYNSIRQDVERACGKKFGLDQFERLIWVWEEGLRDHIEDKEKRGGMGWSIKKARELSMDGKQIFGWGIGIQLEIKINPSLPTFELVGEDECLTGSRGEIDNLKGSNLIALWSKGLERRRALFQKRLQKWINDERALKVDDSASHNLFPSPTEFVTPRKGQKTHNLIPFPTPISKHKQSASLSLQDPESFFPSIPRAHLPSLAGKAKHVSPSKRKGSSSDQLTATPTNENQDIGLGLGLGGLYDGTVKVRERRGSTKDRQKSLMERIKAKEENTQSSALLFPALSISSGGGKSMTPGERKQREKDFLKRRSLLSRLADVADCISMLFSNAHVASSVTRSPKSPSTPSSGSKKKAIPLEEVAGVISKSAKLSLSKAESLEAISLLAELSPSFLQIKIIDKREWVSVSTKSSEGNLLISPSKIASTPLKEAKRKIREELEAGC